MTKRGSVTKRAPVKTPPILDGKHYDSPSEFEAANLLREARRQNNVARGTIPEICLLDPDGDILRALTASGRAVRDEFWACYHTNMYRFVHDEIEFGVVGCAVGASFAVLLAEQMFVSGCRLLISVTSSGQITPIRPPPFFVLIDKALRDEGVSYHYLPPSEYSAANPDLVSLMESAFDDLAEPVERGATWTTDAPYRETAQAIAAARERGLLAVEMEAAALYAFAEARGCDVICFAHVTNQMAQIDGDFEKGEDGGAHDALDLVAACARSWRAHNS